MSNKNFQAVINISLVFITWFYFFVPKVVRTNATDYLIMKISNRKESQNIAVTHSVNIDCKDFMKIYRELQRIYRDLQIIDKKQILFGLLIQPYR